MLKSLRRTRPDYTVDRSTGDAVVLEGAYECGVCWYDAVDGAYAIQYADAGRSVIRHIPTEAEAIRRLLGR